jgi:hypothetical protein
MSKTTIKLKRGNRADLPTTALPGEPLVALDTGELFVGDANGVVQKLSDIVMSDIAPTVKQKFWLDTTVEQLKRWDGTLWKPIAAGIHIGTDQPATKSEFWWDTSVDQLKRWDGTLWKSLNGGVHVGTGEPETKDEFWWDIRQEQLKRWNGFNWISLRGGIHIGADAPIDTSQLWVDDSDENADAILTSDLAKDIRDSITNMKKDVDAVKYAIDYELDPGYFKGVMPGLDPGQAVDPDAPDGLTDGASGTVGHILLKRGLKDDLLGAGVQEGELAWCLDTEELYVGNKGMLKLIAKVGGVGSGSGGDSSGNVTADYVELVANSGQKYRLTVNDDGEPIILPSEVDTLTPLPALSDAGRYKALIINKVYGGGPGRDTNDTPCSHSFIELYNSSDSPINLAGLSLQYGEYLAPWKVLPLRGIVQPYSSFLIRGARHSDPFRKSTRLKIEDFDMSWDLNISDKGFSVYLTVGTTACTYDNPANIDGSWTAAQGYINLFGVASEDVTRIINAYEKTYMHYVNKNRIMKRKYSEDLIYAFGNTGDNGYDIDWVDIPTMDMSVYAPRSSKFGQWDYYYSEVKLDEINPNVLRVGYGQNGDTTRTFTWQSPVTDTGYVKLRKKGQTEWTITVPSQKKFIAHPDVDVTVHGAVVYNLELNTTYIYKVGSEGRWSDEYEHTVIDATDPNRTIRMLWTTDQQSWNFKEVSAWGKASDWLEKNETYDFIYNTGDISQNANRSFEWRQYNHVARHNLATHVEMATVGNNDLVDKLYSYAYAYYSTVENASYPSVFSWNYGLVHYICLDSNILTEPTDATKYIRGTAEQISFIQADMAKPENQKRWVIAFMHESPYTIVKSSKLTAFINALYDAGVDLVFCGHHHCSHRSKRMGRMSGGTITNTTEYVTVNITSPATVNGNVTVTLKGTPYTIAVNAGDSTSVIATKIRAGNFTGSGYTVSGDGTSAIFTATTLGDRATAAFSAGSTGCKGAVSTDVLDPDNGIKYWMSQATGYKLSGKTIPTSNANAVWRAFYDKPGDPCYGMVEISWDKIKYTGYRLTNIMPLEDNAGKDVVRMQYDYDELTPKKNKANVIPAAPGNLRSITVKSNSIDMAWNAVGQATSYNLYMATVSGGPYTLVASNITAWESSYRTSIKTVTGLTPNTSYYFAVTGVNPNGESPKSSEVIVTTAP